MTEESFKENMEDKEKLNELEEVYKHLTEEEKQAFDISFDFGDMEGAKKILENKKKELSKDISLNEKSISILGYYSSDDGSQYIHYESLENQKECLTSGIAEWKDQNEIKRFIADLHREAHLPNREEMLSNLQKNFPDSNLTMYMKSIVGEISFFNGKSVGEVIQYIDKESYQKAIREEIDYQATSGFRYQTFSKDPELRKGIDDIMYNLFGEENPYNLNYYRITSDPEVKELMKGMNGLQKREVQYGIEKKLDVSVYAKPEFHFQQMIEIREGLEKGLDVSVYAKPEFHFEQMKQIKLGLESGLDVAVYDRPQFNQLQMEKIRQGLELGLDVSTYARPEFDSLQMQQIREGLEQGLDVSQYADTSFGFQEMQEIRKGLEQGLDVSRYADPAFGFQEMQEIRKGLKQGLDVSQYANPDLNANQMNEFRMKMERNQGAAKEAWKPDQNVKHEKRRKSHAKRR